MSHCRTLLLYCFKSTSWLPSETDLSLFLLQDKPEAERRRRRKNEFLILTLLQNFCQVAAQNTFVHTKSSYLLRKIFNNLLYFICFGVPFWNSFYCSQQKRSIAWYVWHKTCTAYRPPEEHANQRFQSEWQHSRVFYSSQRMYWCLTNAMQQNL